jgi:hypothetical protein
MLKAALVFGGVSFAYLAKKVKESNEAFASISSEVAKEAFSDHEGIVFSTDANVVSPDMEEEEASKIAQIISKMNSVYSILKNEGSFEAMRTVIDESLKSLQCIFAELKLSTSKKVGEFLRYMETEYQTVCNKFTHMKNRVADVAKAGQEIMVHKGCLVAKTVKDLPHKTYQRVCRVAAKTSKKIFKVCKEKVVPLNELHRTDMALRSMRKFARMNPEETIRIIESIQDFTEFPDIMTIYRVARVFSLGNSVAPTLTLRRKSVKKTIATPEEEEDLDAIFSIYESEGEETEVKPVIYVRNTYGNFTQKAKQIADKHSRKGGCVRDCLRAVCEEGSDLSFVPDFVLPVTAHQVGNIAKKQLGYNPFYLGSTSYKKLLHMSPTVQVPKKNRIPVSTFQYNLDWTEPTEFELSVGAYTDDEYYLNIGKYINANIWNDTSAEISKMKMKRTNRKVGCPELLKMILELESRAFGYDFATRYDLSNSLYNMYANAPDAKSFRRSLEKTVKELYITRGISQSELNAIMKS